MAAAIAHTTTEQADRFANDGFFVLDDVLPASDLQILRGECRRLVDERDREMDRRGVDKLDLDHRGRRYFVHAHGKSPRIRRFLFSELMAQIARTALGDTVYLFNEQYVVKAAERGMRFGWHQDSGFIGYPHPPYLTCWIALDDVSEANGTVHLLPYARAGTRDVVAHVRDEETNDMIGYSGADPGDPVIVRAGSIAYRCSPRTAHDRGTSPNRSSSTGSAGRFSRRRGTRAASRRGRGSRGSCRLRPRRGG